MWYRTGSINVTAGSPAVTGNGTDFVGGITAGSALVTQDGRVYEVQSIQSATSLTLASPYQGGSVGGAGYMVFPTQSLTADLALAVGQLLGSFASVRDGIGKGFIADGSTASPGVRFAADQDTGMRRAGDNVVALVAGGQDVMSVSPAGVATKGTFSPEGIISSIRPYANPGYAYSKIEIGVSLAHAVIEAGGFVDNNTPGNLMISVRGQDAAMSERARFDYNGNLLVGTTSGSSHTFRKGVSGYEGNPVLSIGYAPGEIAGFFAEAGGAPSASRATLKINASAASGRSINAGGTVNASGADYAEYMVKAAGCGVIAKGDVCGVDRDGKLTDRWSDAVSFVVKSTDPSLVGGDTWAAHLTARPEQGEDEDDAAFASRLAKWEAVLENARLCVDRIAFCGQVPCNVGGDFEVGDYIVAAQDGDGIKAVAVKADTITLPQYTGRIGKVWAIRDGRAWIDVQHG